MTRFATRAWRRRAVVLTLLGLFAIGAALPVRAQLISPGKLSAPHAEFEGISKCTSCHVLGQRGSSPDLCLNCHEPLAVRVAEKRGYHGVTVTEPCGTCHKEHFGREFEIVRFDTTTFRHEETGYRLLAAHTEVACATCHRPESVVDRAVVRFKSPAGALAKTYLGVATTCAGCHTPDSPHGDQFGETVCTDCHGQAEWKPTEAFDHAATKYPLTGRHQDVQCAGCHEATVSAAGDSLVAYRGIPFAECSTCHTDPHTGRLGAQCATCHQTAGWAQAAGGGFESTFDHGVTGYRLTGAHQTADCAACHRAGGSSSATVSMRFQRGTATRRYALPVHEACADCHIDVHDGDLPFRRTAAPCTACHGDVAWEPTSFDLVRHATETRFELTGGHIAVACADCHGEAPDTGHPVFTRSDRTCAACHTDTNPHGAQFDTAEGPTACDTCHGVDGWALATYDHEPTDFPLRGRHLTATCIACHKPSDSAPIAYRDLPSQCIDCHAPDDPHAGQFVGQTCETCHDSESFRMASYDHTKTRFPLDGAHAAVPCASCHAQEMASDGTLFVRFKPIDPQCTTCHGS